MPTGSRWFASALTGSGYGPSGYVTIRRRRMALIPLSRTVAAGISRFRVNLSRRNRAILLRTIKAHRTVIAALTFTASEVGAPGQATVGEARIQLRR